MDQIEKNLAEVRRRREILQSEDQKLLQEEARQLAARTKLLEADRIDAQAILEMKNAFIRAKKLRENAELLRYDALVMALGGSPLPFILENTNPVLQHHQDRMAKKPFVNESSEKGWEEFLNTPTNPRGEEMIPRDVESMLNGESLNNDPTTLEKIEDDLSVSEGCEATNSSTTPDHREVETNNWKPEHEQDSSVLPALVEEGNSVAMPAPLEGGNPEVM